MWRGQWSGAWVGNWEGAQASEIVVPPRVGGGAGSWKSGERPRPKREAWREELDRLFAKPIPVVKERPQAPKRITPSSVGLTPKQQAYFDALYARLIASVNAQEVARKAALLAEAENEARAAIELMLLAQAEEAQVRQQMRDFDIVFVAAVLAVS